MGRNYSKELVDKKRSAEKELCSSIMHFVSSMESALEEQRVNCHFARIDRRLDKEELTYPNGDDENISVESEAYYGD